MTTVARNTADSWLAHLPEVASAQVRHVLQHLGDVKRHEEEGEEDHLGADPADAHDHQELIGLPVDQGKQEQQPDAPQDDDEPALCNRDEEEVGEHDEADW